MSGRSPHLRQLLTPAAIVEIAIGYVRFLMEHRQLRASLMRKDREFEIL